MTSKYSGIHINELNILKNSLSQLKNLEKINIYF